MTVGYACDTLYVGGCYDPGQYYLLITPTGTPGSVDCPNRDYTISLDCEPCIACPECEPGMTLEGEPCPNYPDTYNGGCDGSGAVYVSTVDCGEEICGDLWQVGPNKDKDFYEITLTASTLLKWSVYSNLSAIIEILEPLPGCSGTILRAGGAGVRCDTISAQACLQPGTYWLTVTTSAPINVPCEPYTAKVDCEPCDPCVICPASAIAEGEPCPNYNDTYNGGCTSFPPVATPVACGDTICGSAFFADIGDQDFFEIELFERDTLTWCVEAEFPVTAGIYTPAASCADMTVHASGSAPDCVPLCLSVCLEPGVYWLHVTPTASTGIGCGPYVASVHCAPCPEGQPCTFSQLDFDPGNDACRLNNVYVSCEDSLCGDIISPTDVDWYLLWIPSGDPCVTVSIDVFGNDTPGQFPFGYGLDPYVEVYDPDCVTQLAFDDNGGVGNDSRLTTSCLTPGLYHVKVSSAGGTVGPYVLATTCTPCPCPPPCPYQDRDFEPNNSCQTINAEFICGDTLCGEVEPGATPDEDWYLLILQGPNCQQLTIDAFGNDTPGYFGYLAGLDPVVELWDATCATQLGLDDNSGIGNDSRLISDCLDPGNYYVRISGASASSWGPYVVAIECEVCACGDSCAYPNVDFDPANDLCEQANATITCNDTLCGDIIISPTGNPDVDWYYVFLPGPGCQSIAIDIFADDTPGFYGFSGGLDPTVWLWDSNCSNLLEFDYDSGSGDDSRMVSGCLEPGAYRVAVEGANFTVGPYVLALTCRDCPCPCDIACPDGYAIDGEPCPNLGLDTWNGGCATSPPSVVSISCNGPTSRLCGTSFALGGQRDEDWYKLDLSFARRIIWRVTAEFPYEMSILRPNPDCSTLQTVRYRTGNPCQTRGLFAWCLSPGTYYLVVAPTVYNGYPCSDYYMSLKCGYCFVIDVVVVATGVDIKLLWEPDDTDPVYTVHRSPVSDFQLSEETRLGSTTDTEFIDEGVLSTSAEKFFYVVVMEEPEEQEAP